MTRSGCGRARLAAAPVSVPHTRERQEALTAATTHGKKFFMTGAKHITSDNMFKSAKIVSQNAEAVEREKDRKRHLEYHARREAALVESATMAKSLPLGLDKRFVLSINGIRLPWGRYSLPDSTCTFVHRIRIRILIVMRYRIGRHSGLPSTLFSWDSW